MHLHTLYSTPLIWLFLDVGAAGRRKTIQNQEFKIVDFTKYRSSDIRPIIAADSETRTVTHCRSSSNKGSKRWIPRVASPLTRSAVRVVALQLVSCGVRSAT